MCYCVYLGTNRQLEFGNFVPEQTDIFLQQLSEEEQTFLRPKFTKRNIYYVGSDTGCSCGLAFESATFADPDEAINKKSPTRFIELLKELTLTEDIEYYCCWEGGWDLPTEHIQEIDISEISVDKNYWGLTEKEFIKFTRQPA